MIRQQTTWWALNQNYCCIWVDHHLSQCKIWSDGNVCMQVCASRVCGWGRKLRRQSKTSTLLTYDKSIPWAFLIRAGWIAWLVLFTTQTQWNQVCTGQAFEHLVELVLQLTVSILWTHYEIGLSLCSYW
jgi:hypothetical protein